MSHFSVAIFTEPNGKTVEELLAPYSENLDVPHYITKSELISKQRKEIKDYKNSTYAEYLADKEKYIQNCNNEKHIKYISEEFPLMLNWNDEECYLAAIKYEDKENIKEDGSVFQTYNPNSKWDWWEIGGRWASGNDICLVKDIDMSLDKQAYQKAIRTWEIIIEKSPLKDNETTQDLCFLYKDTYYIDHYKNKETYAQICSSKFITYAVITPNGEWHQKGQMGWFGFSSAKGDESLNWDLHYKEHFIDTANENWTVTLVDCHI